MLSDTIKATKAAIYEINKFPALARSIVDRATLRRKDVHPMFTIPQDPLHIITATSVLMALNEPNTQIVVVCYDEFVFGIATKELLDTLGAKYKMTLWRQILLDNQSTITFYNHNNSGYLQNGVSVIIDDVDALTASHLKGLEFPIVLVGGSQLVGFRRDTKPPSELVKGFLKSDMIEICIVKAGKLVCEDDDE